MSPTAGGGSQTATPSRVRVLFFALGAGATMMAATLAALRLTGTVAIALDAPLGPLAAYGLGAVSLALIVGAYLVMKVRVPARTLGQSREEFWATPQVAQRTLVFWAMLEAATTMAAVAYFLTGLTPAAAAIVVALAVYWISGPGTFDRA